jgi:hypothetical protein
MYEIGRALPGRAGVETRPYVSSQNRKM